MTLADDYTNSNSNTDGIHVKDPRATCGVVANSSECLSRSSRCSLSTVSKRRAATSAAT